MNCPLCYKTMRQLDPPHDREWVCENDKEHLPPSMNRRYKEAYRPRFATCEVCGDLHAVGRTREWFACYLGSAKGLDVLERDYRYLSDAKSGTICQLINEVRRLQGWPAHESARP